MAEGVPPHVRPSNLLAGRLKRRSYALDPIGQLPRIFCRQACRWINVFECKAPRSFDPVGILLGGASCIRSDFRDATFAEDADLGGIYAKVNR